MGYVTVFFRSLGLRWYEWVFMGVALAVVGLMYLMYNSLEATKIQLTQAQVTLEQSAHVNEYRNSLFEIDQAIANKYIGDFPDVLKAQRKAREELISGYLILRPGLTNDVIERPVTAIEAPPIDPTVSTVVKPTVVDTPAAELKPKVETPDDAFKDTPEADVAALQFMVDGLHDAYCAAQPTDTDCTTGVPTG